MASVMQSLQSLKTRLHFESFGQHPVLLLILFAVFVLCQEQYFWISLSVCTLYWYLRTKNRSFLIVLSLLCLSALPIYSQTYPRITSGRAVIVKTNYAVLANGRQRVLVYTDGPVELDSEYAIDRTCQKITATKGFYAFDTFAWAHGMGVYYAMEGKNCTLIKEHWTLRHLLQEKIESVTEEQTKQQLYRILLNCRPEAEEEKDFMYSHGFSYAAILLLLNQMLKYFIDKKKRRHILLACNIFLLILYHYPMLLLQSFLFRIFSYTHLDRQQRTALCLILILILYPKCLLTLSFLIPACYRCSFLLRPKEEKKATMLLILFLQSIFMHSVNAVQLLLYPINLFFVGLLWMSSLFTLLLPAIPLVSFCNILNQMNSLTDIFALPGSMLGIGLIFYLLLCFSFRKSKYKYLLYAALFFLFQATGLFHPFGEITTINVGQGDSILIREPLNQQNVLIDTGKPEQWNALNGYLQAKSIHQIDTLVITHFDTDHCGNMEKIIQNYHPTQVIYTYRQKIESDRLILYDLNTIQNADDNESSLVLASRINGLTYLFMGDADETAEKKIALEYDALHCDILKLSHHGSATGSCSLFLDTVRPQLGLISSGAYKIYHHPSPQTIQSLLKRHIEYVDTKENGDISILTFPGFNLLITAEGKLGIIRGS